MKKIQKNMLEKIGKVLFILKEAEDWLHIREIARKTEIHPQTISNIIDKYIYQSVITQNFNEYGLKVKLVKIKDRNIDLEKLLRYLYVIDKIK